MDIALLEEQYNWIKEKQKLETRVILFKRAHDNVICGKSLVSVVPISQEVNNTTAFDEQMTVQEIQFNLPSDLDSDKTPWRAHLGMHRMTRVRNPTEATDAERTDLPAHSGKLAPVGTYAESLSSEASAEESPGNHREQAGRALRKFSAPAVLPTQLSVAVYQPSTASSSSQYYPFPQRKCPKKSEAARRLGMYSSF